MSAQVRAPQHMSSAHADTTAPRKRRKRAPAAGAAADCFTCSNLNLSCDRRRPFCSQCLDHGKDCSGYKTQLTWGVGVASRGKLRGLSLPIAGSTQRASGPISSTKQRKRAAPNERKPSIEPSYNDSPIFSKHDPLGPQVTRNSPIFSFGPIGPTCGPAAIPTNAPWLPGPVANTASASSTLITIKPESVETSMSAYQPGPAQRSTPDRYCGATSANPQEIFNVNSSTSQMSYAESPQSSSYLAASMSNGPTFRNITSDTQAYSITDLLSPDPNASKGVINPLFSFQASPGTYLENDAAIVHLIGDQSEAVSQSTKVLDDDADGVEDISRVNIADEIAVIENMSSTASPLPMDFMFNLTPFGNMTTIGKTPRMQYLINYYAEVISPVIVAFDGPSNPYRTQILRLAAGSETLQHAIAALSASNLRQRRETGSLSSGKTDPARRSSMAHLTLTGKAFHKVGLLSPREQAREETLHKGFAIQSLNAQLADPVLRRDDSILGTLLILCLFHICDSGVAKFQTQFAGVKKLLSLRRRELGIDSKEAKWFTRMFTWFDAMTATVNDREGQLQGPHLDTTSLSDEEWALENLAGCDGQLFKTIAKLGRLNVLSQGKDVDESPTLVSRPLPNLQIGRMDYSNFDGNGWVRIIADEDLFTNKTATPDIQEQFWREWREIRQALQTWQLDTSLFDSTSSEAPLLTGEQRVDLANISESFRYSSLLYTERLASPGAESSEPAIQAWVRQSLNFIKQVKSDVYLLWPLFITGSECVDEADIDVIRERCLDIQRDSGFYNNQSCLELLEKVWKRRERQPGHSGQESGFRFSEVMKAEGNDGEYIVV